MKCLQQLSLLLIELAAKISILTSNLNPKATTLNIIDKENLISIVKFRLFSNITQYINFNQILDDIYIVDLIRTSDIKLNSWVFNCLKNYKLRPTLVVKLILEVFCD